MNPPRPTDAKMRQLASQLEKLIASHEKLIVGNVRASDSLRLDRVRDSLSLLRDARAVLKNGDYDD